MGNTTPHRLDSVFRVLADNRRRSILYYLGETDETVVPLSDLVAHLTQREREWDDTNHPPEATHRERLQLELHHTHLPLLADAQFIEYDAQSKIVRQRDPTAIKQCVEAHAEELDQLCDFFHLPRTAP